MFHLVGLVVAIVAGLGSLTLTYLDRRERADIELQVEPRANIRDFTNEGFGLRASLVNESERAITIRSARLFYDNRQLGEAGGYLPRPAALDRYPVEPAGVTDERLELPVTIPARQERKVVFLFPEIQRPEERRHGSPTDVLIVKPFYSELVRVEGRSRASLELDVIGDDETASHPVRVIPGMTPRFHWQHSLENRGPRVSAVSLRRKLGAPSQSDVVRLDLWKDGSVRFRRTVERPIIGDEATSFPVGALPRGRYIYVFRLGAQTIASARFRNPEPCARRYGGIPFLPAPKYDITGRPVIGTTCRELFGAPPKGLGVAP
jgi:hypothetical protein